MQGISHNLAGGPRKVHHLEGIIGDNGEVTMKLTEAQSEAFAEWVKCNKLMGYRNKEEPAWMMGSDGWRPIILDEEARTTVGGQGAKRGKKRTVAVRDMIIEVDEDLLQVPGGGERCVGTNMTDKLTYLQQTGVQTSAWNG